MVTEAPYTFQPLLYLIAISCAVAIVCLEQTANDRKSHVYLIHIICAADTSTVQLGQEDINGGRDCEPDVCGRPALHGLDDLLPHHLVRPLPDHCVALLPVADAGALRAGWCGGHDSPHPRQCVHSAQSTTAAGQRVGLAGEEGGGGL